MPIFEDLPNLGGTARAYGINTVMMPMQESLLPGGGSVGAGFPSAWIVPGSGHLPKALGLGCARGYAGQVPGGLGATAPAGPSFSNPGNFNTSSSSASNVSNQNQSNTSNITVQAPQGGMLSGDSAPMLLGLGLLAALGYAALK